MFWQITMSKWCSRPLSLTLRLTFFVGTLVSMTLLIFTGFVIYSVEQHFIEQDIIKLKTATQSVKHIFDASDQSDMMTQMAKSGMMTRYVDDDLQLKMDKIAINFPELSFYLSNHHGDVIYKTNHINLVEMSKDIEPSLNVNEQSVKLWQRENKNRSSFDATSKVANNYRIVVVKFDQPNEKTLILALNIDFHQRYLNELHHKLWLATFIIVLLMILVVPLAIVQGHLPLRKITQTIEQINPDKLNIKLHPEQMPIELTKLAISFNQMLEHISESFDRQSNFSADIAHELRTPITNLTTQTQIMLMRPRCIEEYQEILYSNLEQYDRMAKMINDMLFLAQADNQLLILECTTIDLKKEFLLLLDYFEAWTEEREITFKLEGEALQIQGDRLMLQRAFSNLLSNAIRYTPEKQHVTIQFAIVNGLAQICIINPVQASNDIAKEHLPHLFDRFYRVDPSRQRKGDGSGIGLAIVKSIILAHNGSVEATSRDKMITFKLTLPIVITPIC